MAHHPSRVCEWHPQQQSAFASCYGQRLEYYNVLSREKAELVNYREVAQGVQITCLNWYPNSNIRLGVASSADIMTAGTSTGSVSVVKWSQSSASPTAASSFPNLASFGDVFYEPSATTGKRSCTSIQWNRHIRGLLAVGFEKSRSLYFPQVYV